jgi:hypothetical protein
MGTIIEAVATATADDLTTLTLEVHEGCLASAIGGLAIQPETAGGEPVQVPTPEEAKVRRR